MILKVDQKRYIDEKQDPITGIYVRAQLTDESWESVDIAELDSTSLLLWLRSRGGANPFAENVVGILLGHGHLVEGGKKQAPSQHRASLVEVEEEA